MQEDADRTDILAAYIRQQTREATALIAFLLSVAQGTGEFATPNTPVAPQRREVAAALHTIGAQLRAWEEREAEQGGHAG
jgi:hypothetical protein